MKKRNGIRKEFLLNKFKFSLIAIFVLLLSFCVSNYTFGDSKIVKCLTELNKTGLSKIATNNSSNESTMVSNGITVTTSKDDNDLVNTDSAIKINVKSNYAIKKVEAIMYDAKTSKVVNSNFYVDNSISSRNAVLSINAPSIPIERLLLKINVNDLNTSASFQKTFLMNKSVITCYIPNVSDYMLSGSEIYFYADSSSMVPIKNLNYELLEGSKVIDSGMSALVDDSYFITENGTISYNPNYITSGNATFSNIYENSRLSATIKLPSSKNNLTLKVNATDILGNVSSKEKTFSTRNANISFNVSPSSGSNLKVGNKIKVTATCNDGSKLNFGLKKLEVTLSDSNNLVLSKEVVSSYNSSGDGELVCSIATLDKENLKLNAIATDINGNTKTYGPINYKVSYNEFDVTPIFRLSSEPKFMGESEKVSVTSNSGILFTQLTVKIVDEKGNIIKDADGTLKVSQVSSSIGKKDLETTIYYPETEKNAIYFVFSAKDMYGNEYNGGSDFNAMSSVYKKGPIPIYSNQITISASPQTGLINSNSEIKITSKSYKSDTTLKQVNYAFYNDDSIKLNDARKFTSGQIISGIYKFTDGTQINGKLTVTELKNNIVRFTPIVCDAIKKDGYVLYASRPIYDGSYFVMNAYYDKKIDAKDILVSDYSEYDVLSGREILSYSSSKAGQISVTETIKGPNKNANNIVLEVSAYDKNGKLKVSKFNYYQNASSIEIESIPGSTTISSGNFIKGIAKHKDGGRSITSLSASIYDGDKMIYQTNTESKNSNGENVIEFIVPSSCEGKTITVKYTALDSDNNVYEEKYYYNVTSGKNITFNNDDKNNKSLLDSLVSTNPYDGYTALCGRLYGGANEYVIDYKDASGKNTVAILDTKTFTGDNYYYSNVKDMELLSLTKINEALVKNNYQKVNSLDDVNKLYIRLNLYITLTLKNNSSSDYVDVTRKIIVTKNDSNYIKFKNNDYDLGNNINIKDVLDLDMRLEILSKAQSQDIMDIDINNLDANYKILNVYNPNKLSSSEIKSKTIDTSIKFNDSYISSKPSLNDSDMTNGKAFNVTPNEISNDVHVIINKYMIENYSIKIEDNSVHKNHTYVLDNKTGLVNEKCSSDCIIVPSTKVVTCYYQGVKEQCVLNQKANITYGYKYKSIDGTMVDSTSNITPQKNSEGKIFVVATAKYETNDLYDLARTKVNGDFGLEIDSAYKDDANIKSFEIESEGRWVLFDGLVTEEEIGPKVKINMNNIENNFFYNNEKERYERSSDLGSDIKLNVSSVSPLKDIKVAFKTKSQSDYGTFTTLHSFSEISKVLNKEVNITLPDGIITYGGEVMVKVVATNYNNESSNGKVQIAGSSKKDFLKLFINTSYGTNPIPRISGKSVSLYNNDGSINDKVLKQIGEGKYDGIHKSALSITKACDVKWGGSNGNYTVDKMSIYHNTLNDIVGLGYRMQFNFVTTGYGTDYHIVDNKEQGDMLIANMKFFAKYGNNFVEVIPYVENNNQYEMAQYQSKYRQLRMIANPNTNNDDVSGLNKLSVEDDKVNWNFSFYLPSNTKFKLKSNTNGDYIRPSEILVQMDLECYKYYSIGEDGVFIKDASNKDSRHLYTLRENKFRQTEGTEYVSDIAIKNVKVPLRGLVNSNKGCVFWYDCEKDATFDINQNRY